MLSLNINDFSARYYDPAIGRFYSIDPIFNPATSPYAYCGNNPVNYIDPTGMAMMPNIYQDGTVKEGVHGLGSYSGSGGPAGSGWTLGSGHQNSWATWGGSSRSYTDMVRQTDPAFYAQYYENCINSGKFSHYALNDYFAVKNADGTTTWRYWDVIAQAEGTKTGYPGFHWHANYGGQEWCAGKHQAETATSEEEFKNVPGKDPRDEDYRWAHDHPIKTNPALTPLWDINLGLHLMWSSPFEKSTWITDTGWPVPTYVEGLFFMTIAPVWHFLF